MKDAKGLRVIMGNLRGALPGRETVINGRAKLLLPADLSAGEASLTRAAAGALVDLAAEADRVRNLLRLALAETADPAVRREALEAAAAWVG